MCRTRSSLLKYELMSSFIIANGSNKIIETRTCKNNNDKKHFSQDLKRNEVVLLIKHNIIKGDNRTKTFIRIYLNAKLIIRVNEAT